MRQNVQKMCKEVQKYARTCQKMWKNDQKCAKMCKKYVRMCKTMRERARNVQTMCINVQKYATTARNVHKCVKVKLGFPFRLSFELRPQDRLGLDLRPFGLRFEGFTLNSMLSLSVLSLGV